MSITEIKAELSRLSLSQRLELLWESVDNKDDVESPAWHGEELRVREQELASGEAKFVPWEEAKAEIVRRTS
jgi:hypothetical protein